MSIIYKTMLRSKYYKIRKSIQKRSELQENIFRLFKESDLYKNADCIFCYSAIGSEASVDSVIESALKDGKKVALPVCLDEKGNMEFYFIKSLDDTAKGMYGIKEPDTDRCTKAIFDKSTVCLVPGLSFDLKGNRLGYGKGYYDRFLSCFSGKSVGICFESCLCDELIIDEHDKKVNYLITDKKIHIFRK